MTFIKTWFLRLCEFVAAMLLAAIFFIFILQIVARYMSKLAWLMPIPGISSWMASVEPLGWTINLISLLWVWAIFFGCACIVREREHVTFDILYQSAGRRVKLAMTVIALTVIIVLLLWSFGPTWETIMANRLMVLKKIQTLRVPITGDKIAIKWLYAAYIFFMGLIILRYLWGLMTALMGRPPETELDKVAKTQSEAPG